VKIKARKPTIPRSALDTVRHSIISLLREGALSAKDISFGVHIPEKEVYGHLEHIRRSIHSSDDLLDVTPAECSACGFVFAKRERLTPPGKCPVCRHENIIDPLFSIRIRTS